jgi:hypothetical protein
MQKNHTKNLFPFIKIRSAYFLFVLFIATACQAQLFQKKSKQTNTGSNEGATNWSQYRGSFNDFIQQAIRNKTTAVIDKDFSTNETITVDGDLIVKGTGITITTNSKNLFILGAGNHVFSDFNIVQNNAEAATFFTKQESGILWNNTLRNMQITGGQDGYLSSRGGRYDAATDSVLQWSGTTIENCIIKVKGGIAISVFSQDGPCKFLHMRNVQMGTDVTHNLYIHPNVSMRFDSVVSLYAGKLAMHHFSGGNEQFYYTARYFEMKRVSSLKNSNWEMVRPRTGYIQITDCDIAPFTTMGVDVPYVYATNSRFYNAGNGAQLSGVLNNCSGEIWSGSGSKTLEVNGGNFSEVSFRNGGSIKINNATIDYVFVADRGQNFEGSFTNCTINHIIDGKNGKGKVQLLNSKAPHIDARPEIIIKK